MFTPLFAADPMHYLFGIVMFMTSLFLILLVLVQRGRGGGLSGAFGGMGGQSAFGTKAGDTFTKITFGTASFWIILCVLAIGVLNSRAGKFNDTGDGQTGISAQPGDTDPASPSPDGTLSTDPAGASGTPSDTSSGTTPGPAESTDTNSSTTPAESDDSN